MGTIHAARIESSPRLKRVHQFLSDGKWHTTREIVRGADVCAVNSIITELRANGYDIGSRCTGRGRYEYQLIIEGQGGLF